MLTFLQDRLVLRTLEAELPARALAVCPILEAALATPMAAHDALLGGALLVSLVARLQAHAPLNPLMDPQTLYGGGAHGHTD